MIQPMSVMTGLSGRSGGLDMSLTTRAGVAGTCAAGTCAAETCAAGACPAGTFLAGTFLAGAFLAGAFLAEIWAARSRATDRGGGGARFSPIPSTLGART